MIGPVQERRIGTVGSRTRGDPVELGLVRAAHRALCAGRDDSRKARRRYGARQIGRVGPGGERSKARDIAARDAEEGLGLGGGEVGDVPCCGRAEDGRTDRSCEHAARHFVGADREACRSRRARDVPTRECRQARRCHGAGEVRSIRAGGESAEAGNGPHRLGAGVGRAVAKLRVGRVGGGARCNGVELRLVGRRHEPARRARRGRCPGVASRSLLAVERRLKAGDVSNDVGMGGRGVGPGRLLSIQGGLEAGDVADGMGMGRRREGRRLAGDARPGEVGRQRVGSCGLLRVEGRLQPRHVGDRMRMGGGSVASGRLRRETERRDDIAEAKRDCADAPVERCDACRAPRR
jgi:hypothetical protein